jgi:YidC/Oxa1 family membrane protein insertase
MTALWGGFLEIFQVSLFWLTQFYGGQLASAIVTFSLLARVALLPVTVRLALRARAQARSLQKIRPQLEGVRARWAKDPQRLMKESRAVYEREGVRPLDVGLLKGGLAQTPVFLGLFQAVRAALAQPGAGQPFLWIANLSRPDVGVAVLAMSLMGLSTAAGASQAQPNWAFAVPVISGGVMALMFSAGFGLYLASTGLVGTLQGLIVRRIEAGDASGA